MALATQCAEHERKLEILLAQRDAEALDALRLLDLQYRRQQSNAADDHRKEAGRSTAIAKAIITSEDTVTLQAAVTADGKLNTGADASAVGNNTRREDASARKASMTNPTATTKAAPLRTKRDMRPSTAITMPVEGGGRPEKEQEGGASPAATSALIPVLLSGGESSPIATATTPGEDTAASKTNTRRSRLGSSRSSAASRASKARRKSAVKAAAGARDAALREATEESNRLGEVLPPTEGGDGGARSPPPTTRRSFEKSYSVDRNESGDGREVRGRGARSSFELGGDLSGYNANDWDSSNRGSISPASSNGTRTAAVTRRRGEISAIGDANADKQGQQAVTIAPAWTVGNATVSSFGRSPVAERGSAAILGYVGSDGFTSAAPLLGVDDNNAYTVSGDGSGFIVLGGGEERTAPGLTATERRYRGELEAMRARVRELEGMMEFRLEERERVYRRKLRAAVTECRSIRVSKLS